jgi:GDP-mannose pyrophosphatase NudK
VAEENVRIVAEKLLSDNWGTLTAVTFDIRRRDGRWQRQLREIYDRGNAAAILLADPVRGTVVLTRQFRLPVHLAGEDGMLVEACAGLLEGDDPEVCARKEAEEETGYRVGEVRHLFDAHMSPGSVTEKLSLFIGIYDAASRSSSGGGLADEGEDIEVLEIPFSTAFAMIGSGAITDAKTILLLQSAALDGLFAAATDQSRKGS